MRQSNTITALVIAAMPSNWARHYLINLGFYRHTTKIIMDLITRDQKHVTGDIKYVRYILDIMS